MVDEGEGGPLDKVKSKRYLGMSGFIGDFHIFGIKFHMGSNDRADVLSLVTPVINPVVTFVGGGSGGGEADQF